MGRKRLQLKAPVPRIVCPKRRTPPGAPFEAGEAVRSRTEIGRKKLSSESTVWWRDVFPPVWTVAVGIGMLGIWLEWWGSPTPLRLKIMGAVVWAVTSVLFALRGRLLHEVWLGKDRLYVSKGGPPREILLRDVTGLSESRGRKLKTIKINLRPGSPLGDVIRFVPPLRLHAPFTEHPVIGKIAEQKQRLPGTSGSARLPS
jgi:hypothetical protein